MSNPFCHVELSTENPGKAKEFYARVFDWTFEEMPSPMPGGYTYIKVGEGTGGGLMQKRMPEAPNAWLAYVLVSDVASTLKKARDLGAHVILERMVVPDMGAFAIFADPTGAALGIWESAKK